MEENWRRGLLSDSEEDDQLVRHCHPATYRNPESTGRYNLVVIGAGAAGLVSAGGAGMFGGKVALIERALLGGDCLTFGCVPSKAVLRAARAIYDQRNGERFGGRLAEDPIVDFGAVMQRMRQVRARISQHDSVERFTRAYGVDVYLGEARFLNRETIEVAGRRLRFSRAIVATGGRPAIPAIPGLEEAGYETNETIFGRTTLPGQLVVLGAGPVGCELAQAFRRFGSQVALIDPQPQILPREDPEISQILADRLRQEGVSLHLGVQPVRVERTVEGRRIVHLASRTGGEPSGLEGDTILVATGRAPHLEGLGLEQAGIVFTDAGIQVNDFLQTSNERVYAAGDVCSAIKLTHAADAMARIAVRNALFAGRERVSRLLIPRCTYTDPEIAHLGPNGQELDPEQIETRTEDLCHNDRALLDGEEEGRVRLHIHRRTGKIVGASIAARHAGDLLATIAVAMTGGLSIKSLARTIFPYPTQAEAIRRIADQYSLAQWGPRQRGLLRRWLAWQRR
jgi:pyruvate/2-oxoglutarate dehydrogenase complex dihydrolipoamide dehydrogenase (E3) component